MGLVETFNFSLCSKRTFEIIKRAVRRCNHSLSVTINGRKCEFKIKEKKGTIRVLGSYEHPFASNQSGFLHGQRYRKHVEDDYMGFYFTCQQPWTGLKLIVEHMSTLYDRPMANELVLKNTKVEEISELFLYLRDSITRLVFENNCKVEKARKSFPSLKYIEYRFFWAMSAFHDVSWEYEEVNIRDGKFFEYRKLPMLKCPYLTIENPFWAPEEVSEYLKQWIAGDLPWIRHHTIGVSDFQEHLLLDEIRHVKNDQRVLRIPNHNKTRNRQALQAAYDIQSDRGLQATCFVSEAANGGIVVDLVVRD